MTEIQILEARIEEYKKTIKAQEREIDKLEANIAGIIGNNEIYQKNLELLNKLIDKIGGCGGCY